MAGDATGNRMNEMFDKFWSEYPRRAKKADARKAFAKAISLVEFATMIQGAQRYAQEVSGRAMRYIMLPGTWLRGECWDDEAGANDDSRVYSVVKVAMSEDEKWRHRLKNYKPGGFWSPHWGSKPEHGGTDISHRALAEWRARNEKESAA